MSETEQAPSQSKGRARMGLAPHTLGIVGPLLAAGTIAPEPSGATTRDETLPCVPELTRAWDSFERVRIDLASHVATRVAFEAPRLSTER